MLCAYGDESADEEAQRVFAVAGLVGSEEEWKSLTDPWVERLGGKVFHAAECESDKGEFEGIDHKDNLALYADLTKLLHGSKLFGFGAAINLIEYNRIFPGSLDDHPYYLCFFDVVSELAWTGRLFIPSERVKFTFDRTQREPAAKELYGFMVDNDQWILGDYLHDEVSFASRKTVGVQVADLLARETMKHLDNQIGPVKRKIRQGVSLLASSGRMRFQFYNREGLQAMKAEAENIPAHVMIAYHEWLAKRGQKDSRFERLKFLRFYKGTNPR